MEMTLSAATPANDNTMSKPTLHRSTVTHTRGAKYNADLDVKDIAAAFRADVKAAVKAGTLPAGLKLGVKIDRYSMGCSINVEIKAAPGIPMHNPAWLASDSNNRPSGTARYSVEMTALIADLDNMLAAYNKTASETNADYYNCKFHGFIRVAYELEGSSK